MRQATTATIDARTGWAVVTGASSGLGREFALALAERGHPVLAVARRGERLRALADEVDAGGARLEPLVADLSMPAGVEALLARAGELGGVGGSEAGGSEVGDPVEDPATPRRPVPVGGAHDEAEPDLVLG